MQGLKIVAGAGQIVYGTDYPFGSFAKHLAGLRECGFNAAELQGIYRGNALKLFRRLNS
jgi:predicted TIM-barrel fold metal-dependent hydrolase